MSVLALPSRKKVLIFIDWYLPGFRGGGPVKSCSNLVRLLGDELDFFVVTRNTDFNNAVPYKNIRSDSWITTNESSRVYYFSKRSLSFNNLNKLIEEIDPDIVYLNSMYSISFSLIPLILSKRIKNKKPKVILAPRGMLFSSAIKQKNFKKEIFLFFFRLFSLHRNILFHSTTTDETAAIIKVFSGASIIEAGNIPTIRNYKFVEILKEKGKLKCLFASRIVPIKNLLFVIEVMARVKAEIELTIVGPIEDENYWSQCQRAMLFLPSNIKVVYFGGAENETLLDIFSKNHIFFLPTLGENFGHVIFESFLMGRPVIISDQTPWKDLQNSFLGWDLDLNNKSAFISAVEEAAAWNQQEFMKWAYSAYKFGNQNKNTEGLKDKYLRLFS